MILFCLLHIILIDFVNVVSCLQNSFYAKFQRDKVVSMLKTVMVFVSLGASSVPQGGWVLEAD